MEAKFERKKKSEAKLNLSPILTNRWEEEGEVIGWGGVPKYCGKETSGRCGEGKIELWSLHPLSPLPTPLHWSAPPHPCRPLCCSQPSSPPALSRSLTLKVPLPTPFPASRTNTVVKCIFIQWLEGMVSGKEGKGSWWLGLWWWFQVVRGRIWPMVGRKTSENGKKIRFSGDREWKNLFGQFIPSPTRLMKWLGWTWINWFFFL